MNAKHTPGPWNAFYKAKYDEWHVSVPMEGCGFKQALFTDGCPTGEADARLIAASPDMLEALTLCQSTLANLINPNTATSGVGIQSAYVQCVEAEVKARAALSKAQVQS